MSLSASSPPPRLISDELWELAELPIPPQPPAVHGRTGRLRPSDRDVLEGIAFVLSTGIGWAELPRALGDAGWWLTPLWRYAASAVVICSRAAAERLTVPVEEMARRIAARHGLEVPA